MRPPALPTQPVMRVRISLVNVITMPPAMVSMPLARWEGSVALEGQAQLEDAEAQQDEADGPDEGKNEVAQICHNRQRIVRREGRTDGHDRDQHKAGKHGVNALDPLFEFYDSCCILLVFIGVIGGKCRKKFMSRNHRCLVLPVVNIGWPASQ